MKKTAILFILGIALTCGVWYAQGRLAEKIETLIWAAYDGDLTGVKNALEDGAPLDWSLFVTDPERQYQNAELSVLAAAASGGNNSIVQYLIKQGVPVNLANSRGWTPLFIAVRDGHAETAAQLVHAGADINAATDTGATPLITALITSFDTEKNRQSLVEYLLKRGADVNAQTKYEEDALFYAVTLQKNQVLVQTLLDYQADPCRSYNGKNIVQLAQEHHAGKDLQKLLEQAYSTCTAL